MPEQESGFGITFMASAWKYGLTRTTETSTGESQNHPFIMFRAHNVDMATGEISSDEMMVQMIIPEENWEEFVRSVARRFFYTLAEKGEKL